MATETHILDTERAYENNKVLIVDDNLTSKAILEDILNQNGYETRYALDGKEGLRILAEWKPNVVLLDLVMPEMDGYGVCRQIREMNQSPRPSVIIISVKDDKSSVVNSLACGAIRWPSCHRPPATSSIRRSRICRRSSPRKRPRGSTSIPTMPVGA